MARTTRTPRENVAHVTYHPSADGTVGLAEVLFHGTKAAALEHAVEQSQKYAPVKPGETLAAAIDRYAAERAAAKATPPRVTAPAAAPAVKS